MDKNFCPFIKSTCRNDCVFKSHKVAQGSNVYDCLIAVKLSGIDLIQYDVAEIMELVRSKKD